MSNRTLQKFKSGSFFTVIPPIFIEQLGVKVGDGLDILLENEKIVIKKGRIFDDVNRGLELVVKGLRKDLGKK